MLSPSRTYHPFGSTSYELHTNDSEVSLKRYQYVGKERDGESGLYYYGARYYADWLCRFVSVDPLKDDYPYLNVYNYAGNMPITHYDIDGLQGTGNTPVGEQRVLETFPEFNSPISFDVPQSRPLEEPVDLKSKLVPPDQSLPNDNTVVANLYVINPESISPSESPPLDYSIFKVLGIVNVGVSGGTTNFYYLDDRYITTEGGRIYLKSDHMGKKQLNQHSSTRVTDDFHHSYKFLAKVGLTFDLVIVLNDANNLWNAIEEGKDYNSEVGALIVDGTGMILGLIHPLLGLIYGAGVLMYQLEGSKAEIQVARREMKKIRERHNNEWHYLIDPEYQKYEKKINSGGIPKDLIFEQGRF